MKKRILIAQFKHETNSFSPIPADMQSYKNSALYFGEDVIKAYSSTENEIGGVINVFKDEDDFELVPCIGFNATPSGPVTKEVYELAKTSICDMLKESAPFDGVLLSLHGAMVSEVTPDGEGTLLEKIRSIVGPQIPVIVTLDLHTNCTSKMANNATALIPYREYPHTDVYPTAILAAKLMRDTLRNKVTPKMGYRRIPYLLPLFPTAFEPMKSYNQKAMDLEELDGVITVRITHGFFPADIEEMGMSVVAITNGDQTKADELATNLAMDLWNHKDSLIRDFYDLDGALDEALASIPLANGKPIVLGDASDNTGAGGLGDTTHILRRVLERHLTGFAFGPMVDAQSVKKCFEAGIGAEVELDLGGWSDPTYSGGPLHVKGIVKTLTDGKYRNIDEQDRGVLHKMGPTAVLEVDGNIVVVGTLPVQPLDVASIMSCGIIPSSWPIIVVKSAVHYRASFGKIAYKLIDVNVPGYAVPLPNGFEYKNWKDPVSK